MAELKYLKKELEKIKNGEDSFLGIDGGNIKSKIWVCGVEFGGTLEDMADYYSEDNKKNIKSRKIDKYGVPYRTECPVVSEKSPYDKYLSLFYQIIFNENKKSKEEYIKNINKIFQGELYNSESEIFKLNLYPLAKKDTSWDKTYDEIFTITKEKYYGEIFDMRKKFFKKLIEKFSPKTIICSITKNSEHIFADAFFEHEKDWVKVKWKVINRKVDNNKFKRFKISIYKKDSLSLIMIPFFGMGTGNLNSHDDVIFMAKHLKEHYLKKELF